MAWLYLKIDGKTFEFRASREAVEKAGAELHARLPDVYGGHDSRTYSRKGGR